MNKSSIFFSITVTFVALFIFIVVSFGVVYKGSQKREELFNYKRSFDIAHSIKKELRRDAFITQELEDYLELMDFKIVKDKHKLLISQDKQLKWEKHRRGQDISSFELDSKNYLHLKNHGIDIVLLDMHESSDFRIILYLIVHHLINYKKSSFFINVYISK